MVFEINKIIIKNLRKNLIQNNCKFTLFNNNLVLQNEPRTSNYFISEDFLNTSQYDKKGEIKKVENINIKKIFKFKEFNTLIIDGDNLFNSKQINSLFFKLKKNKFILVDKCFNSYFFKKV